MSMCQADGIRCLFCGQTFGPKDCQEKEASSNAEIDETPANQVEKNEVDTGKDESSESSTQAANDRSSLVEGKKLIYLGAMVAAPCVGATLLGFGTAGVVAGSVAAGFQSSVGSIAAGSFFATMQSLGASSIFATGAVAGGALAGAGATVEGVKHFSGKEKNSHEDSQSEKLRCPHCGFSF